MRGARLLFFALAVLLSGLLVAQAGSGTRKGKALNAWELASHNTDVPGMGDEVPGASLLTKGKARLKYGDSTAYASRSYVDSAWQKPRLFEDSTHQGKGVHWLRFRLLPDSSLKGRTLVLGLGRSARMEVFLNGNPLFSSFEGPAADSSSAPFLVPFAFRCDGQPEVIAIRLENVDGKAAVRFARGCSLHAADVAYQNQRSMTQSGVFIGINLVILLLALVIWSFERRERQWIFLALLSFVSALDTLCESAANMGLEEVADFVPNLIAAVQIFLIPWSMYLLIMTLGTFEGKVGQRRRMWYTISIVAASVACLLLAGAFIFQWVSFVKSGSKASFTFSGNQTGWWAVPFVLSAVILGVVMVWFIIEVIRLGFRLMRTKGYARWIGAGALASSLLAFLLGMLKGMLPIGPGVSTILQVIGDYCSHVAVPLSVAVYLAIRTAHQGRLVARQRDDLDLEVKERTAELSAEKERSDELLLNILPAEVAEELKTTGTAKARHFQQASVLFTDFQGFTSLSAELDADALLGELNACFEAFDGIITQHGIEKIKTIGDAYMCVGGIPDPDSSSPAAVVRAALEMQAFMAARKKDQDAKGLPAFEMRVGIHTGPVVAGIVGVKKFQYDIWGDTVNTASRMESSGEVGQVNISGATYELVKDATVSQLSVAGSQLSGWAPSPERLTTPDACRDNEQPITQPAFRFTPRGKVRVKGKGEMEMYFVSRR